MVENITSQVEGQGEEEDTRLVQSREWQAL